MRPADGIVVGLLFAVAFGLGAGYARAARQSSTGPDIPSLNRRVFGAAVMSACGRSMTTPTLPPKAGPATPDNQRPFVEFLDRRRDVLSCDEIPAGISVEGLDGAQRASRYLILLVAGPWALAGPSWPAIDRLIGVLFAMSIGLAYLLGRLAMGRVAAAAVAVLFMLSPIHLANLTDLRDYSKTPFFAASLFIVGLLVLRRRAASTVWIASAAAGALLGFGFGVRTDIALNLVVVLAAVIAFLPGRLAETWKVRLVAALVCVSAFAAVAAPIVGSGTSGSNLWHWALLGYAHDSDRALDVAPAAYEPGYFYSDSYVATIVDAYWSRTTVAAAQVSVGLPDYAIASRQYYARLLGSFPADALLRGWASVIKVLELPYEGAQTIPAGLLPGVVTRLIAAVGFVLARWTGLGLPLFAVVALLVSVRSVRLATLMCGLVGFLGAYPAIQFQPRHVFHLELLPLWLLGLAASSVGLVIARKADAASLLGQPNLRGGRWLLRPALFAAGVLAIVLLPLTTLRAYQQQTAAALLAAYDDARKEPIVLVPTPIAEGDVRGTLGVRRPSGQRPRSMYSEMLAVEIGAEGCPADRPEVTFRYRAADPAVDFSRTYAVARPDAGASTTVYFPVYETGETNPNPSLLAIDGIEAAASEWPCITRVSRFADPDTFPLLLGAVLPADWRTRPLHQTLREWERSPRDGEPPVSYWLPRDLRARRAAILARFEKGGSRVGADVDFRSPIARVERGSRIVVDGLAASSGSYLVAWTALPMSAHSVLVVEGNLERGGLTAGLANTAGWAAKLDVTAAGPFRIVVEAPAPGWYQIVVANHLDERSLRNRLTIARVGVVDGGHE